MSKYDKWEVRTALPKDFKDFDNWAIQTPDLNMNDHTDGIIYHLHHILHVEVDMNIQQSILYMTKEGKCRKCGAQAPPGLLFLARTIKLSDLGV